MTNIQQEIWKDVVGYEGFYQVSNFGNVKSLERKVKRGANAFSIEREKILKGKTAHRYTQVGLSKYGVVRNRMVHRLVAIAFIPNPENKEQVNHKDGNKRNNHVDNLEWNTHQENSTHAWETGLYTKESIAKMNEITSILMLDTETGIFYKNMKEASESLCKSKCYISSCRRERFKNYAIPKYINKRFIKC